MTLRVLIIFTICFLSLGLSACETIGGAGRDIEKAGEAVQDSAD